LDRFDGRHDRAAPTIRVIDVVNGEASTVADGRKAIAL
jgi:hypothetical protein